MLFSIYRPHFNLIFSILHTQYFSLPRVHDQQQEPSYPSNGFPSFDLHRWYSVQRDFSFYILCFRCPRFSYNGSALTHVYYRHFRWIRHIHVNNFIWKFRCAPVRKLTVSWQVQLLWLSSGNLVSKFSCYFGSVVSSYTCFRRKSLLYLIILIKIIKESQHHLTLKK